MSVDNNYFGRLPVNRYGLPMKQILVRYINHQNNRDIPDPYFWFGLPEPTGTAGLVKLPIKFTTESGWETNEEQYLEYTRQSIATAIPTGQLTIHLPVDDVDVDTLTQACFNQYGLFLDAGFYEFVETDSDGAVIDPPVTPDGSDRWFKLVIDPTHLLLEGEVKVRVVASIVGLGTTISRLVDIRTYYTNVEAGKFPTELYTKSLNLNVESEYGYMLYRLGEGTFPEESCLATMLKELTGDEWVNNMFLNKPFNIAHFTVVYNGLSSDEYPAVDPSYPYILVLQLSDTFCSNLEGFLQIGYRNDRKQFPGYVGGLTIRPVPILT